MRPAKFYPQQLKMSHGAPVLAQLNSPLTLCILDNDFKHVPKDTLPLARQVKYLSSWQMSNWIIGTLPKKPAHLWESGRYSCWAQSVLHECHLKTVCTRFCAGVMHISGDHSRLCSPKSSKGSLKAPRLASERKNCTCQYFTSGMQPFTLALAV